MYVEGGGEYGEFSFSTCNFWKPTPLLFGIIFSLPTPSFHNPQLWAKYHELLPPHTHPSPSFRLLMHHPLTFHVKNTQSHNVYAHKVC